MARFRECPRCHNYERGYTVFRCKHCGKHWCWKGGFFSNSGCGADMARCPNCGRQKKVGLISDSFATAGYIG